MMLIACGSTEPKGDLFFEGTVISAVTGAPVAEAHIGVGDGSGFGIRVVQSTTTDAQGHYTLSHEGCIHTPYIEVMAQGFNYTDKEVGCRAGTQTVDFALTVYPFAP